MTKSIRSMLAASLMAVLLAGVATATSAAGDTAGKKFSLVFSGVAVPNIKPAPNIQAFADWCNAATGACYPTVQQPVFDTTTGKKMGMVYVWGAFPFNAGTIFPGAICFSEFMVFELSGGELYAHSAPNGTCGAFMDPVLKPPKYTDLGATAVIAGGGDGVIRGGTGRFQKWTGTFTDRVFVGFGAPTSGVGGIIYYDQLLFVISGD